MSRKALFGILVFLLATKERSLRAQIFDRLWWYPGSISTLPQPDSLRLSDSLNLVALDFQHTLSLFSWSSGVHLTSNNFFQNNPLAPRFGVSAEGRSRLREDTRIRTSEGSALISSDYPFDVQRNGLIASFFGTSYSLSGSEQNFTQNGTLRNVSDGYGVLGGKYFPVPALEVTASGGITRKSFEVGAGSGTIIKGGAGLSPSPLSNEDTVDASLAVDERRYSLADEVLRNDNIHAHFFSALRENGYNDAAGGMYLKRRDFFFQRDTSGSLAKQERSELGFDLHDIFNYPIVSRRLFGNFRVDLSPHQITRRTPSVNIDSLPTTTLTTSTFLIPSTTSALEAAVSGRLDLFLGKNPETMQLADLSAEMKYEEKSENNDIIKGETGSLSAQRVKQLSDALNATSFDGRVTTVNLGAYIPLAERDALRSDFSARIYRYDTPSADNHDDRDELNLSSTTQYLHFFSLAFSLNSQLRLTQSHLVYLESDRSLQNYVSKTIALSTQSIYFSPVIQHQLRGEVFANYSVYDFSAPVTDPTGVRDYLIRGVNGSDSIRIYLGKFPVVPNAECAIEGIADLRLYERGAYNDSAFTERPVLRTSELSAELTFDIADRYSSAPTLVRIGVRGFFLRRSSPNTSSQKTDLFLQQKIDRVGPLLLVIIDEPAINGPRLYGSVWYSFVNQQIFDVPSSSNSHQIEARLSAQWVF